MHPDDGHSRSIKDQVERELHSSPQNQMQTDPTAVTVEPVLVSTETTQGNGEDSYAKG